MKDEGPADRVMRAIRATHPWPPNPSLAGEIADCETRAASDSPDAAAYARRAAELRELAKQPGIEGLWQILAERGDPKAVGYLQAPLTGVALLDRDGGVTEHVPLPPGTAFVTVHTAPSDPLPLCGNSTRSCVPGACVDPDHIPDALIVRLARDRDRTEDPDGDALAELLFDETGATMTTSRQAVQRAIAAGLLTCSHRHGDPLIDAEPTAAGLARLA